MGARTPLYPRKESSLFGAGGELTSRRDCLAGAMSTLALRARTMMRSPLAARSRMMSGHSIEEAIGARRPHDTCQATLPAD